MNFNISSGIKSIPDKMPTWSSVPSIFGANNAITDIEESHLQQPILLPIIYSGGFILTLSSFIFYVNFTDRYKLSEEQAQLMAVRVQAVLED